MKSLFAYGTLMCAEIFQAVAGELVPHSPGILAGFRRWSVRNEYYPAIVPDQAVHVEGVVYHRLPEPLWARLDRFEGEMYARQEVLIDLGGGERVFADTYVCRPAYVTRLERADWDFEEFLNRHRDRFLRYLD